MKKKLKVKKKRKVLGTLNIFIILLILLITISVGYSMFSTQFKILGNVSIIKPTVELPTEFSKSYATWEIKNSWPGYYDIMISITNLDEDINGWVISIDVPKDVVESEIHAYWSAETTFETIGDYDRITFKNYDYNREIPNGGKLEVPLMFKLEGELEVINLIINNKLITDFTQITQSNTEE